jgi:hypothetical protein
MMEEWLFDVPAGTPVVTTAYVTSREKHVLLVTHEFDSEEGVVWQFHAGDGEYSPDVLMLVRLDEIVALDPTLHGVARLPIGMQARRTHRGSEWEFTSLEAV